MLPIIEGGAGSDQPTSGTAQPLECGERASTISLRNIATGGGSSALSDVDDLSHSVAQLGLPAAAAVPTCEGSARSASWSVVPEPAMGAEIAAAIASSPIFPVLATSSAPAGMDTHGESAPPGLSPLQCLQGPIEMTAMRELAMLLSSVDPVLSAALSREARSRGALERICSLVSSADRATHQAALVCLAQLFTPSVDPIGS